MALDTNEKQSSLKGAAGIESGKVSWPWTHMKSKAHSREILTALPGDREWESKLAVDTDEKQSSLEGDVNCAARGSRVGDSVGRGHI